MTINYPPIIIFGSSISSWGVLRGLREIKTGPIYLVSKKKGLASFSRHVSCTYCLDCFSEDYIENVVNLCASMPMQPLLMVAGDDDALEALSRAHGVLSDVCIPCFPAWKIVSSVIDKEVCYEKAASIGLRSIETLKISSGEEFSRFLLSDEANALTYPVFLKSSRSRLFFQRFKTKGVICHSLSQVKDAYSLYQGFMGCMLLQPLIPGDIDELVAVLLVVSPSGEVLSSFVNKKIRSATRYGSTSLSVEIDDPTLVDKAIALVHEVGYVGAVGVQFKYDSSISDYRFLEINGRFSVSNALSTFAGVNMPALVYQAFSGMNCGYSLGYFFDNGRKPFSCWYPLDDFRILFQMRFYRNPRKYLLFFFNAKILIEPFSLSDPLPALFASVSSLWSVASKLFNLLRSLFSARI